MAHPKGINPHHPRSFAMLTLLITLIASSTYGWWRRRQNAADKA
ncbi:hypothetical protein [Novosphingobium terrae]|nr:hypothetical protein [Novosphingobium terrae]